MLCTLSYVSLTRVLPKNPTVGWCYTGLCQADALLRFQIVSISSAYYSCNCSLKHIIGYIHP